MTNFTRGLSETTKKGMQKAEDMKLARTLHK